jgi:hypothetical protein
VRTLHSNNNETDRITGAHYNGKRMQTKLKRKNPEKSFIPSAFTPFFRLTSGPLSGITYSSDLSDKAEYPEEA